MEPARITPPGAEPQPFEDFLGQRQRLAENTEGAVDQLVLKASLASVPSFEFALRERANRLASFRHACYVRVRGVERGAGPGAPLRIVSDTAEGIRLSDLLAGAEARRVPVDINAALCLVRQLVPAIAMLQESARDVAHGAIGPERLLVTPTARLLITEYVLGAALEQLRWTRADYWTTLRIPVPASAGSARFDHRTDVLQIGMVALALILGRPIRQDEFPGRIGDVVASTWAVSPRGGFEPLPPGLRRWLGRTLQIDPSNAFRSAVEARAELDKVLGDSDYVASPANLETFLTRYHAAAPPAETADSVPQAAPIREPYRLDAVVSNSQGSVPSPAPVAESPAKTVTEAASPSRPPTPQPVERSVPESLTGSTIGAAPAPAALAPPPAVLTPPTPAPALVRPTVDFPEGVDEPSHASPPDDDVLEDDETDTRSLDTAMPGETFHALDRLRSRVAPLWQNRRMAGAAVAVLVVLVAGGAFVTRRPPEVHASSAASGTLEVVTNPAGIDVMVDGLVRGPTPLTLALEPGAHVLTLERDGNSRSIPVSIAAGAVVSHHIDMPANAAARSGPASSPPPAPSSRPAQPPAAGAASGWVTVASALDVDVMLNGARVGGNRDRIELPAGRHQLTLVNTRLGVQIPQSVQVDPGGTTSVDVAVPNGTLSVNAQPWADVWVDGEKVGETPIGNLSLPVGSHDIVFRHPELGERHHTAVVSLAEPTRLSVDLRTP